MYYRNFDGISWSSPVSTGLQGGQPTITVTPSGEIFVANKSPWPANQIQYVHGDGSTWTAPTSLGVSARPDLSVDHDGVVHIAYSSGGAPAFRTWQGTDWSDETALEGPCGGRLEMFHSTDGAADILCRAGNHWHREGTNWQGPMQFIPASPNALWPGDATGSPDGTLLAIWGWGDRRAEDPIVRVWTGSRWLQPERVSDTSGISQWPTVAISSNRQAVAVWSHNSGGFPFILKASTAQLPIFVSIDIKPGGDPNSINCGNGAEIVTVAITSTDEFDATSVDHSSVSFQGASEIHIDKKTGAPRLHEEDVDFDGDLDLVFHFRLADTSLTCDSLEGMLIGQTSDGKSIQGIDGLSMVP